MLSLSMAGFAMVAAFMALIMTKRLSAVAGLVAVPIACALLLGLGGEVGGYVADGVAKVAPTAVMLMFAILYFGLMIDAGLFVPLVDGIVRWAGVDPVRVTLGHTALAAAVALDGDGTTTILVCASAMLPIYRKLGMNPLIFATLTGLCSILMNYSPWGGPTARVAASLKVDPAAVFLPLLPAIATGLLATFALAYYFGVSERRRLGDLGVTDASGDERVRNAVEAFKSDPAARRPKLILVNLALTVALMTAVILHLAPLLVLFMGGFVIALIVNYPKLEDQRARVMAHAGSVLNVAVMVLAAGAFTGVMSGSGMIKAMADTMTGVVPPQLGPYLGLVTGVLSMPLTFFLSNDAYYFGVVPVVAETAQAYGFTSIEIARASLLGQPVHSLSPLVAAVYLKCAIVGVELGELQRFAFRWFFAIALIVIAVAIATGAVPLRV